MKPNYLFILLIALSACSASRKLKYHYGHFTDERDGHVYKTVKIGRQIWMAENLNYDFQGKSRSIASANYYDNNPENGKTYGRLYNFDALLQGAAPKGWHIPSDAEWREMEAACPNPVSTLMIVYGGEFGTGQFRSLGEMATFYTSTQDGYPIITRYVGKGGETLHTNHQGIGWQLSVRCVKDYK